MTEIFGIPIPLLTEYEYVFREILLYVSMIRHTESDIRIRKDAAKTLRIYLKQCAVDRNLSELTEVYRKEKENNVLGYSALAINRFLENIHFILDMLDFISDEEFCGKIPKNLEMPQIEDDWQYPELFYFCLRSLHMDTTKFAERLPSAVTAVTNSMEPDFVLLGQLFSDWFIASQTTLDLRFRLATLERLVRRLRSVRHDSVLWPLLSQIPKTDLVFEYNVEEIGSYLYQCLDLITETGLNYQFFIHFLMGSVPEKLRSSHLYQMFLGLFLYDEA